MVELMRVVFVVIGAVGAYQIAQSVELPSPLIAYRVPVLILLIIVGSGLGYVVGGVVGRRLVSILSWAENRVHKLPTVDLMLAVAGLIVGVVLAWLISIPFGYVKIPFLQFVVALLALTILGYLGVKIALRRREDFRRFALGAGGEAAVPGGISAVDKLLDTSAIIDGRIVDVCRTGFIEGKLVAPQFVLRELQMIADSDDPLRRNRGRRGLDVLKALQHEKRISLQIVDADYPDAPDVDGKLVRLAKDTGAMIFTNDYNLNKLAELQGVQVLNLNELANALKPVVLPGEQMAVTLIREGKEAGQGVGYLDDGTMIVVDGGKSHVGEEVEVLVTSVLQTPAGRMIFTKLKEAQEAGRN